MTSFELREVQKLEGHTDRVWSLAWKPATGADGVPAVLASCSADKTVRIWEQNPATGSFHCKAVLEGIHTRTVRSCAWNASGTMATASVDATAAIWKDVGGDFSCVSTLKFHANEVNSVSWNALGTLLATCGQDKSICVWKGSPINNFQSVSMLEGHTKDVKMVQWHPSVDILFSCSYDKSIKVWAGDWEGADECIQTLNVSSSGHRSTVWALSFNASGDKMVSCSGDLTIKIWGSNIMRMQPPNQYAPWTHIQNLSGYHSRTIFSIHWSREGIICSGAADDAICFFIESKDDWVNEHSYKLLYKKEKAHEMDVNAVQWSSKGNRVLASASDDGTVKIWEFVSVPGNKHTRF